MDCINHRNLSLVIIFTIITVIIVLESLQTNIQEEQEFTLNLPSTKPNELTTEQYLEDYEYLCTMVETNYPYLALKNRTHHNNWLDRKQIISTQLRNTTTNTDFLAIISKEIIALHNRHTRLLTPNEVIEYHKTYSDVPYMAQIFSQQVMEANQYWQPYYLDYYTATNIRYPVEIIYSKGIYIITNYQGNINTSYGTNLTLSHINGVPVQESIETASAYIDYDYIRDQSYLWAITSTIFPEANLTIQYPNGTQITLILPTLYGTPKTNFYPSPNLITCTYPNHSTAYIYIKTFDPTIIQEIIPTIRQFLQETKNYEYLLIDIRGNTGGAFQSWLDTFVTPLLTEPVLHEYYLGYRNDPYIKSFHNDWLSIREKVPKEHFTDLPPEILSDDYSIYNSSSKYYPTDTTNHTAKRILLTDRTVYSAAEGFANFCKQTGFATIIGTTTGGDGFFVWPVYIVLPHSKLVITMTSSMSLDKYGRANEKDRTIPDIIYETSITDHQELVDYTLTLIKQGKIQ